MATAKAKTAKTDDKAAKIAALSAELNGSKPRTKKVDLDDLATLFQKKASTRSSGDFMLSFGMVAIPVKSYKATDKETVSFNQAHLCNHAEISAAQDKVATLEAAGQTTEDIEVPTPILTRLKRAMYCPQCEDAAWDTLKTTVDALLAAEEVTDEDIEALTAATAAARGASALPDAEITRVYEHAKGEYVTVTDEELDGCKPQTDGKLDVTGFVPVDAIDAKYYEELYFLSPDEGHDESFATIREALVRSKMVGIARVVQRGREHAVAIRPVGDRALSMTYLYFEHEVRDFDKCKNVRTSFDERGEKMVDVAVKLIELLATDFKPEEMYDSYLVNTKQMLAAKAAGEKLPVVVTPKAEEAPTDLMAALQASLSLAPSKAASRKTITRKAA